ncbi:hypothetical protein CVV65_06895 [Kyrpidia spormannii]|uniref:Cation-transporting P-type ATPase N-terminal domain-containing protein n=1 Tax=Kyrpidia spormannii TaxID=2055160 RepID=A0A2K8N7W9_9BACL|nr:MULTISPECIES: cation-transporting P-type ATPase [Kyrpidia]ATY84690.1 hypothetical protein CVV65_06895 [Kyrpidia spormannii]MCL6577152.1 hypothetical protein [Kyrpidia sp.]
MGEEQAPMHSGLTEREAAQRLRVKGFNHLPQSRRKPLSRIVFEVVREPMFLPFEG